MTRFEALVSPDPPAGESSGSSLRSREDPSLRHYMQAVEALLTDEEKVTIETSIDGALLDEDGIQRPYNDLAKEVFCLAQEPSLAQATIRIKDKTHKNLRDYLITRVDVLLQKHQRRSDSETSGTFSTVPDESSAVKESSLQMGNEKPVLKREHEIKIEERRAISKMNLESLLSTRKIGSIQPPTCGQFNQDFSLPLSDGMGRLGGVMDSPAEPRHVERFEQSSLRHGDIVLELPSWRIRNKVLPVPANHLVVGCPHQALSLIDPDDENPFCTRVVNEIEVDRFYYVVRPRIQPLRVDPEKYIPDEAEREEIARTLPFPVSEDGQDLSNVTTAKRVVMEYMGKHFIYCCDDRMGEFIARHPDELGTIVDGLQMGHCDILAWTAARYLRQMGHAALVVGTEISEDEGTGFARDMTHSRVGVIQASGRVTHLDPTAACANIDGYALSHIDDAEMAELEEAFDQAKDQAQKQSILRSFRARVNEVEHFSQAVEAKEAGQVHKLEDQDSALDDIMISDEEVSHYFATVPNFASSGLSRASRIELNKLADLFAGVQLPLMSDGVMTWRAVEQKQQISTKDFLSREPINSNPP